MQKVAMFTIATISTTAISSIVLVVSFLSNFITMENFQQNVTYWILAGMILPMVALTSVKIIQYTQSEKLQIDYTPFRDKANKEAYSNHLKVDIYEPIAKQVNDMADYTFALVGLPMDAKEMIICHFYTGEKHSKHYQNLFSSYADLMNYERTVRIKNVELHEYLQDIKHWLWNLKFENTKWGEPDTKIEFLEKQFLSSLNIDDELGLLKIENMYETVSKIHSYNNVNTDFSDDPKYYFTINHKRVFQAPYELIQKYFNEFQQKISKFQELATESRGNMSVTLNSRTIGYERILRSNFIAIKQGKPIIGACKACIQNFTGKEKIKYDKLITRFENEKKSLGFP